MKRSLDQRLRQVRPTALDAVPGADRRERDLATIFEQSPEPGSRLARQSQYGSTATRFPALRPVLAVTAAATAVAVIAAVTGAALDEPVTETAQPADTVTNTPRAAVARAVLFEAAAIAGEATDLSLQPHTFWHRTGLWVGSTPGPTGTTLVRRRDEDWISVHDDDRGVRTQRYTDGHTVVEPIVPGSSPFTLGDQKISVAELLKLPTEPQALKAVLLARRPPDRAAGSGYDPRLNIKPNDWIFIAGAALVTNLPVRVGTRAAAFRMLADLPAVKVTPNAKDAIGRRGTAVSISLEQAPSGTFEHRLVFDPKTSAALSNEMRVLAAGTGTPRFKPGSVLKGTVNQSIEWTTRKPPPR